MGVESGWLYVLITRIERRGNREQRPLNPPLVKTGLLLMPPRARFREELANLEFRT